MIRRRAAHNTRKGKSFQTGQTQTIWPHCQEQNQITRLAKKARITRKVKIDVNMIIPAKEKGKATKKRPVEDVIFSVEMAALDFEPTREEDTFLQLIGLDRFVTPVTWEIVNISMEQDVITILDLDTMQYALNGQLFSPRTGRTK
jgi:hypothetical protein